MDLDLNDFDDQSDGWILIQAHNFKDSTTFDSKTWSEYKSGFSHGYGYSDAACLHRHQNFVFFFLVGKSHLSWKFLNLSKSVYQS